MKWRILSQNWGMGSCFRLKTAVLLTMNLYIYSLFSISRVTVCHRFFLSFSPSSCVNACWFPPAVWPEFVEHRWPAYLECVRIGLPMYSCDSWDMCSNELYKQVKKISHLIVGKFVGMTCLNAGFGIKIRGRAYIIRGLRDCFQG